MRLRGIEFGPCFDGAGLRGFGSGYWPHRLFPFWYDFTGSTFVSKTLLTEPFAGNLPLRDSAHGFEPKEWFPKSIKIDFVEARALNAVGLSCPGAGEVLRGGMLEREEPFFISFMPSGTDTRERERDCALFADLLQTRLSLLLQERKPVFGIQLNVCPNAELEPDVMLREAPTMLDILSVLRVPLMVKVSLVSPVALVSALHDSPQCDALCVTNSAHFRNLGKLGLRHLYPGESPLSSLGGGSLSGAPLLPRLANWLRLRETIGLTKPVVAGGGIMSGDDVRFLVEAGELRSGVDAVSFATAALVRPWRMGRIIAAAHEYLA